jgi:hypothetical protein
VPLNFSWCVAKSLNDKESIHKQLYFHHFDLFLHLGVPPNRVARWPFFGPFLANVAIFESHFLEKN